MCCVFGKIFHAFWRILALALFNVLTIKSNSIILSLTGGHVGWITYTSLPLTFSKILTLTSPSAKRATVAFPRLIPSVFAISRDKAKLPLPEKSLRAPACFFALWAASSRRFSSAVISEGDSSAKSFGDVREKLIDLVPFGSSRGFSQKETLAVETMPNVPAASFAIIVIYWFHSPFSFPLL